MLEGRLMAKAVDDPTSRELGSQSSIQIVVHAEGSATLPPDHMEKRWDFALVDLADVLGVALDHEGRIVDWNASCERATGYSFDDVRGQCFWDFLVVSEDREGVKKAFGDLLSAQSPVRYESAWLTKSGERRWVLWNCASIVGPDGRVEYVVGTGVDMTERKRLEEERLQLLATAEDERRRAEQEREAARRSALLVTSIVENIPDTVFLKDAKTLAFVLLNRAAEELLGWDRPEMLGKTGTEFFPEDEMRFFAEKDRALASASAKRSIIAWASAFVRSTHPSTASSLRAQRATNPSWSTYRLSGTIAW
jgi:PAS domain S-box-containing protein